MTTVNERPYLSIGEVLGLLLEEFPDVTISKIRFLESQGLIEPERTSSGYRKFYDGDVERLKVILREQRENFLPLRVIRDRLEAQAMDDSAAPGAALGGSPLAGSPSAEASTSAAAPGAVAPAAPSPGAAPRGIRNLRVADPPPPSDDDENESATTSAAAGAATMARHPAAQPLPTPPAVAPPAPVVAAMGNSMRGEIYSRVELCGLAGIEPADLEQLESFGIVTGRGSGPHATFTDSELAIVRAAAGFLARGIDARHLRGWRQSAEREAGLFEQRILPLLRQRNPQARQDATQLLNELAALGAELRAAIVSATLRHHLEP
jgi:DNA-binding transcriptional MerR regulator